MPAFEAYPSLLRWRHVLPRMLLLNQALLIVGVLSLHATEVLSPAHPHTQGLLYYFVWLQCVGNAGIGVTAVSMLATARRGWRRLPDAASRAQQVGVYRALPAAVHWQLGAVTLLSVPIAAWVAQQAFIAVQGSAWGQAWLTQTYPPYHITLFNTVYGTLSAYVFEFFHERRLHSEARERLARQLTAQAQLDLLRSQLDPHMLFNTLSNVYELIEDSPDQARAMLLHLNGFLRATLDGSRASQHALADEFRLAEHYLALMRIRMGERLRAELALPPELAAERVPAMLLQPLLENAIQHGLEQRREGGHVRVAASQDGGELVLSVANTGAGRSAQPGPFELPACPSPALGGPLTPRAGFGLQYVRERLKALYGDAARVELRQASGPHDTLVTLRLPLGPPAHPPVYPPAYPPPYPPLHPLQEETA